MNSFKSTMVGVVGMACAALSCSGEVSGEVLDMDGEMDIQAIQQELTVALEFDTVTPSVICNFDADACNVSLARGNGSSANTIVRYERDINEANYHKIDNNLGKSNQRPFLWLRPQNAPPAWETLYNDAVTGEILADGTTIEGPLLSDFKPVGPPTAVVRNDSSAFNNHSCAYFRGTNNLIQESCLIDDTWHGWQMAGQTQTARSSPIAVAHGCGETDLYYACGTGTTTCQLKPEDDFNSLRTYTFNFGSGNFHAGTRPTVLYTSSYGLWSFAATTSGSTRKIIAMKDWGWCSEPSYQSFTLDTQNNSSNYRYSTPMPYVRADGQLAVIYFRTATSPSNSTTRIREQTWTGDFWNSATTIKDTGVTIPAGAGAPVPHVDASNNRNVILYRKPYSSGVRETILLEQQANGSWTTITLPNP